MHLSTENAIFSVFSNWQETDLIDNFYHARLWVGNIFSHVCLSDCLSVQAITFEPLVRYEGIALP